jgi:hypothetical protein
MVILTGIGGFGPSALDHGPEPKVSEAKSRIRFSQKIIVKQEALALPDSGWIRLLNVRIAHKYS